MGLPLQIPNLADLQAYAGDMSNLLTSITTTAVFTALSLHTICHRLEPNCVAFAGAHGAATAALAYALSSAYGLPLVSAVLYSLYALTVHLVALAGSITLYRNSPLHPLYRFPGPFAARTSALWFFWQMYTGKPRIALQKVHEKYGDIVRIAPDELSINNVNAVTPIHGSRGWPKSYSYEIGLLTAAPSPEEANLLCQRHHQAHTVRRRIWDKAFSTSALAEYTPALMLRTQQLIQQLCKRSGKVVDFHTWGGYFVYDMMSDLAFGGGFQLLEKGEDPVGLLPVIVMANSLHGLIDSLTWVRAVFDLLPTSQAITRVFKFSRGRFEERAAKGSQSGIKDVFHYLLDEDSETGNKLSHEVLAKESQLIVGAGSDTTRTTITLAMRHLTQNKDIYNRLQAEVDNILQTESLSTSALDRAPLLNAVVNESLRLLPPITSGVKRESPGAMILGKFIPAGTTVRTPNYTLSRDPRYFSPGPNEFRPDRWLSSKQEEAFDRSAFFPFMVKLDLASRSAELGPFGCIGKGIALHEIRMVIASIVATFDAEFAPGFDLVHFEDGIRDRFVAEFDNPLLLVLTQRKEVVKPNRI